jgi:hypothetical protein
MPPAPTGAAGRSLYGPLNGTAMSTVVSVPPRLLELQATAPAPRSAAIAAILARPEEKSEGSRVPDRIDPSSWCC